MHCLGPCRQTKTCFSRVMIVRLAQSQLFAAIVPRISFGFWSARMQLTAYEYAVVSNATGESMCLRRCNDAEIVD